MLPLAMAGLAAAGTVIAGLFADKAIKKSANPVIPAGTPIPTNAGIPDSNSIPNPTGGQTVIATGPQLPAGADIAAAQSAIRLLLANTQYTLGPAASWVKKFQTSVGLPSTGKVDTATRSFLIQIDPNASNINIQS